MQLLRPDGVWTVDGFREDVIVAVAHGSIVGIGPAARHPEPHERLAGRVLMPGLVNAHSHAFQRAIRGFAQQIRGSGDFWTWRDAMYRAANGLDPDGIFAVSRLAFLEMVEAGITAVGEFHYLHHAPDGAPYADPDLLARRVIDAALDVGLRIALLRVAYARNGAGEALRPDQRRMGDRDPDAVLAALDRLGAHPDPRVSVGLAPHSVRAVPADWLRALAAFPGIVHAHVAEQPREVAQCRAEHGRSPLQVFADAGLLSARFTAVHLTWPDPGDLDALAAADGTAAVCPTTELDLGDGFFPGELYRGRVAVGSDSHASIDALVEARLVDGFARARAGRRGVGEGAPAARVLRAATVDGARCLGLRADGIAVGAPADLVAVRVDGPRLAGVPAEEGLAFAATAADVSDVWVGGARVVAEGRHPRREGIVRAALPYLVA